MKGSLSAEASELEISCTWNEKQFENPGFAFRPGRPVLEPYSQGGTSLLICAR